MSAVNSLDAVEAHFGQHVPSLTADQADELVSVVQQIVAGLQPERIYLFGSHARGDADDDSDIDLLVVVSPSDEPAFKTAKRAQLMLERQRHIALGMLVWTRRDFDARLGALSSLPMTVLREGIVLYTRDADAIPEASALRPNQERALAEAHDWLEIADHQLRTYTGLDDDLEQFAAIVAIHAQVAADRGLRAFLAARQHVFSNIRNLPDLLDTCIGFDPVFRQFQQPSRILARYTDDMCYEADYRKPTAAEAQWTYKTATEIVGTVRTLLEMNETQGHRP
jgi:uncharacterized protein